MPSASSPSASSRMALEALYEHAGGARWRVRSRWLRGNVCKWHGIECDDDGEVTSIDLGGNGAVGTLPIALGNLSQLRVLNIDESKLSGTLPRGVGVLSKLRTILLASNVAFSGTLPALNALASLTELDLSRTRLSGTLAGPSLGSLHALQRLQLDHTQLSGTLPSSLPAHASSIFVHESRRLSGSLPTQLFALPSLELGLSVAGTSVSGTLPSQVGLATKLRALWLVHTRLSGSVPAAVGSLAGLHELELHANWLHGTLPSSLGSLRQLRRCVLTTRQGVHQARHSMRPVDRDEPDTNRFDCPLPPRLPAPCVPHLECGHAATRSTPVEGAEREQRGRGGGRGRGGRGRRGQHRGGRRMSVG